MSSKNCVSLISQPLDSFFIVFIIPPLFVCACYLLFVICYSLFVIRYLLFDICYLIFVTCYLLY
ncbi:hypothetical protein CJ214_01030 [Peptoniphilus lacrimalis]|nr:hypothetical protein CJ214_01030 [Peptoniphilus lacrimalis]